MLLNRIYQSILPRHTLCYTNKLSPLSLSPTVVYQIHHSQYTSSAKRQYQSTHQPTPPDRKQNTMPDSQAEPSPNSSSSSSEDWKSQPPYRTTAGNADFSKKWTAHCHCGRVRYWLSRAAPLASKFCHCVDCQALHGAPFQWAAIFEKADLHFESGVDGLAFYHAPDKTTDHKLPCKVSCASCHSPIMDEGRKMVLMFPGIIEFGDAERKKVFDPKCHIFYSQRVVDIHDGKPKWSGLDGQSKEMTEVDTSDSNGHTVVGEPSNEHIEN